jgi:hypothetical protein
VDVHNLDDALTLDVNLVREELDVFENDTFVRWDAEDLLENRRDQELLETVTTWTLYVTEVHIIKVVNDHALDELRTFPEILMPFLRDARVPTCHVSLVGCRTRALLGKVPLT